MNKHRQETRHGLTPLILCAVLGLAAVARLQGLGAENYWLDELHSLADSAGHRRVLEKIPHGVILNGLPRYTNLTPDSSWRTTWHTMEEDSHPPLYFTMLVTWRQLFGDGEFSVRSLTALFSVFSIVPVALMLAQLGRARAAVWLALVLALAFAHVHMGREARPYAVGIFWVSLSFWLLVRMEVNWSRWKSAGRIVHAVAYAVSIYLAAMTHYFAVLPLTGQGIYALLRLRGRLRWVAAGLMFLAAAAWAVTWGPQFLGQMDFIAQQNWILERRDDHITRTLLRLLDLPVRLLFNHELFTFHPLRSVVGGLVFAGVLWLTYRYRRGPMLLFSLWFLVPVLTFLLIDLTAERQLLSHLRYSSVVVPGLAGVIVLGLDRLPNLMRWGAIGLLLLAMALAPDQPSQLNPLSRETAAMIAAEMQPGDLLIYDAVGWPPFWAARLYHVISFYLHPPSPAFVLLREQAGPALLDKIRAYQRVIVVSPRYEEAPNPLPDSYDHTYATKHVRGIGFVHLFTRKG